MDELDCDDHNNNLKGMNMKLKVSQFKFIPNDALSVHKKSRQYLETKYCLNQQIIPKGYTKAASTSYPLLLTHSTHSDEIICSFFSQQASMPTTHDDEDLLQIDEDAMEEIDIRWQVAMITARIRKFMRKTGRPMNRQAKEWGSLLTNQRVKCFNCQKLGHFARECRFAKYQENRANGRQEKKTVAIEDSNSKALVATDNNEDIDWTKEFDAEPTTFAMMHDQKFEKDEWRHGRYLTVPTCSKSFKLLLENYQKERDNFQRARTEILGYQMSLESLEVILKTHEKNEYAWGDKYEQMEYDLKIRDLKLEEKQKELDQALKERDDFKVKLENGQMLLITSKRNPRVPQQYVHELLIEVNYPSDGNRNPRISSYSPSSRSSTTRTPHRPYRPKKIVKSIWVKKGSTVGSQAVLPQTVKKSAMINPKQTWRPKGNYLDSVEKGSMVSYTLKQFERRSQDYAIIDSGCSGSMTGDKDKLSDFKEFKGGYVAFGNDSKGGCQYLGRRLVSWQCKKQTICAKNFY
ncbi:ribonuclease H-like domain-containing protein [Tanacetum coccineum]